MLCVPSVALATIASAGPDNLVGTSFDESTVGCPKGKVATGGGFSISRDGIIGGSSITVPDSDTEWHSRVHAHPGPDGSWSAFAVCRSGNPADLSTQTDDAPIKNFGAHVTASCDDGEKVVGGGYQVSPPRDPETDTGSLLNIGESGRVSGQRWRVFGVSDLEADGSLTAHVVCITSGQGKVTSVSKQVDLDDRTQAKATCPKGKPLVSGGFDWSGASAAVHSSMPVSSRTWKAALRMNGAPDPDGFLEVVAYCMAN